MNDTRNQTSRRRNVWRKSILSLVMTLLISGGTYFYGARAYDFVAARMFKPSAEVAAIHTQLGLTGEGSDLFYASNPSVEDSAQFNASCSSAERTAAILGCYYKRQIHIYNVTNTELAEAKDVSAAHEMLHAAYERLTFFDKSNIDTMLQAEYSKLKDNAELQRLMDYYKQAEPEALTNELHSIIGTTVASLSPDLESYYRRYFTNRQNIVAMNKAYNDVFVAVESKADELTAKVDALKPQLNSALASYNTDIEQLNTDIATFNSRARGGYYTSRAVLDADRAALNARANTLNSERSLINERIAEYNGYVAELKQLSVKVNQLNNSINGITTPEATL